MNNFQYVRAEGLDGAARFVAGHGGAKFIGGGTNLVDLMKYNVERPSALVDLNRLKLHEVTRLADGGVRIGALVTNSDDGVPPCHFNAVSPALASHPRGSERATAQQGDHRRQPATEDAVRVLLRHGGSLQQARARDRLPREGRHQPHSWRFWEPVWSASRRIPPTCVLRWRLLGPSCR